MRKIDKAVLNFLHKITNWTYKKLSLNNYGLATIFSVMAAAASVFIASMAIQLASTDKNPRVAQMRTSASLFAGLFFIGLAFATLYFQKGIAEFLSRKYDLDNTKAIFGGLAIFFRWYFIVMYPVSILLGNKWWGMLDTLLLGIALMFLSCEPPKMEVRMAKIFRE